MQQPRSVITGMSTEECGVRYDEVRCASSPQIRQGKRMDGATDEMKNKGWAGTRGGHHRVILYVPTF